MEDSLLYKNGIHLMYDFHSLVYGGGCGGGGSEGILNNTQKPWLNDLIRANSPPMRRLVGVRLYRRARKLFRLISSGLASNYRRLHIPWTNRAEQGENF